MNMNKDIMILRLECRIAILSERPKDNERIVRKLKRQYKMLTGKEYAAAGAETV